MGEDEGTQKKRKRKKETDKGVNDDTQPAQILRFILGDNRNVIKGTLKHMHHINVCMAVTEIHHRLTKKAFVQPWKIIGIE